MKVRLARRKDAPELIRLAAQWLNPLYQMQLKTKILLGSLRDVNEKIFVAEHEGKIVAFIDIYIHWDWMTALNKVWLVHCYTDSQYRHKGLASTLINFVMKEINWDWFFVDYKTEEARALYLKMGFKQNSNRGWLEIYQKDLKK